MQPACNGGGNEEIGLHALSKMKARYLSESPFASAKGRVLLAE